MDKKALPFLPHLSPGTNPLLQFALSSVSKSAVSLTVSCHVASDCAPKKAEAYQLNVTR